MANSSGQVITYVQVYGNLDYRIVSHKARQSWDQGQIKVKSPNMIKSTISAVLDCDKV